MIVEEFCISLLVLEHSLDILVDIWLVTQNLSYYFYVLSQGADVKVM